MIRLVDPFGLFDFYPNVILFFLGYFPPVCLVVPLVKITATAYGIYFNECKAQVLQNKHPAYIDRIAVFSQFLFVVCCLLFVVCHNVTILAP